MAIGLDPPRQIEGAPAYTALLAALHEVVSRCSYSTLDELGAHVAGRPGRRRLSELVRGTRQPFPERHEIAALVKVCAPPRTASILAMFDAAAAERTLLAQTPSVRWSDYALEGVVQRFTDWAALGVHRPITQLASGDLTARVDAGELPTYVPRATDLDPDPGKGLRATLAQARADAAPGVRSVVVCGESSAGKTRAAVEAMRAELGGWRLLIPYSGAHLGQLLDQHPRLAHTVVWLDEIDRIAGEPGGVAQLQRLLGHDDHPIVMLGTLRTDREQALRGTAAWDLLDRRAQRIPLRRRPLGDEFDRELARARDLAAADAWLAEALKRIGDRYGIAEWLAAGPQLMRALDRARTSTNVMERVGAAVVDAAIECYRAGYTAPCPRRLLSEAHQLYLDDPLSPTPSEQLDQAMEWARRPVAGAIGMLVARPGCGDQAFDYLLGSAQTRPKRETTAPDATNALPSPEFWQIVLRHATPKTLITIGNVAVYSAPSDIVQECLDRADSERRAELLHMMGERELLAQLAGAPQPEPSLDDDYGSHLAMLLAEQGDIEALVQRADAGDWCASQQLARLLAERDDYDELARRVAHGDLAAERELLERLVVDGDIAELMRRWTTEPSITHLDPLLRVLRQRNDAAGLADLADQGNAAAANALSWLLKANGNLSELERRAEAGDEHAAEQLAWVRIERMSPEELRQAWNARDPRGSDAYAQSLLSRAWNRDPEAARILTELSDVAHPHSELARWRLAELLQKRGDRVELTRRADAGDKYAARSLAELLLDCGDEEELTRRVALGDHAAEARLHHLRAARGRSSEAR